VLKIDYKFSTVCEKNEKMSGPLGGFFLTHTVYVRHCSTVSSVYSYCLQIRVLSSAILRHNPVN